MQWEAGLRLGSTETQLRKWGERARLPNTGEKHSAHPAIPLRQARARSANARGVSLQLWGHHGLGGPVGAPASGSRTPLADSRHADTYLKA